MDLNIVVLCGRLATRGELKEFESGSRLLRLLVTVRAEAPARRVDVVPVTVWDPDDELVAAAAETGCRVWLTGSVQRRFWEGPDGSRSRLEVVAGNVTVREPEAEEVGG